MSAVKFSVKLVPANMVFLNCCGKYLWLELGWILDRGIKNRQYPEDKNFIKSWLNQRKQLKREIATM